MPKSGDGAELTVPAVSPALKNIPINSTYHDQALDAILDNIKMLTGATIEKNGSEITIK